MKLIPGELGSVPGGPSHKALGLQCRSQERADKTVPVANISAQHLKTKRRILETTPIISRLTGEALQKESEPQTCRTLKSEPNFNAQLTDL